MRLYTNNKGAWAGTQADAKKLEGNYEFEDVPTDKQGLMDFLNWHAVGGNLKYIEVETDVPQHTNLQSCSANRDVREAASLNRYDVSDVVLNCPKQHLGNALAAIISRLNDQLGEI